MSKMRRLMDETQNPLVRELLASGETDRSEKGACDRALDALGMAAATTVAASATASAVASASTGAKGAGALSIAPTAKSGALLLVHWIGIGTLGGAVAIGSVHYAQRVTAPTVPSARATPNPPVRHDSPVRHEARATPPPVVESPIDRPGSPDVDPEPRAPLLGATPPADNGTSASSSPTMKTWRAAEANRALPVSTPIGPSLESSTSSTDSVRAQVEALHAIRDVLGSGGPERALTLLDEFARAHPSSPLGEEVTVLRIDALVDAGRRTEATSIADAFLRKHPSSAYAQRLRSKLKSP
jgi:hypothetical protein